jgi:glycosyltransferase involved in cell wall biosynthesis
MKPPNPVGPDLLIFEPACSGHRLHYVRRLAQALKERSIDGLLVTSAESAQDPRFAIAMEGAEIACAGEDISMESGGLLKRQMYLHAKLGEACLKFRPKQVLVPFGNQLDKAVALLRPKGISEVSLLVMRDRFHLTPSGAVGPTGEKFRAEEWTHRKLIGSSYVRRLFTIDPLLPTYSHKRGFRGAEKVRHIADPGTPFVRESKTDSRAFFGIPEDARVLLLYGAFDGRKGVQEALNGVSAIADANVCILAVGRQGPGVTAAFTGESANKLRKEGRLFEVNEYVSLDVERRAFSAADAVWVGYRGHFGQSGVLFQAASAELPVVATHEGLIGYEARAGELGEIVSDFTPRTLATHILKVLYPKAADSERWIRGARRVAQDHDEANFAPTILNALGL